MQDPITQSEQDTLYNSGDLSALSRERTEPSGIDLIEQKRPAEPLKGKPPVTETPSPFRYIGGLRAQRYTQLPQRGLSYAALAGVIAGVLAALLTIVITLVNAGTFHAARLQIAVDRLTVKTALALVAWELLTFTLSLLVGLFVGLIVGRIAVRRRLGFMAGALAGSVCFLMIFFVSLIPNYPGNLTVNGAPIDRKSVV